MKLDLREYLSFIIVENYFDKFQWILVKVFI